MTASKTGFAQNLDAPASPSRTLRVGAGTTQRFVLLVALFLGGSLSMLSDLLLLVTDPHNDLAGCALAAGVDPVHNSPANYLATATAPFHTCINDFIGPWKMLWQPLIALAGVMVLAVLLFLLLPRWKRYRTRVVPLRHAETAQWLASLAAACGLAKTPEFVVDPAALFSANAVVSGRLGHYTIRLDMGLVKLFQTDRDAFEATLMHEFAHISNKDADITYLTIAIWRVFLAAVLIPFAAVAGWKLASVELATDPFNAMGPGLTRDLILAAFMVILMYLTTADLLRAREIYADLDAVAHGASATYWVRQREHESRPAGSGRGPVLAACRAVLSLLRTHPDWETRVAALDDASAPVTASALQMVLTGVSVEVLGYLLTFTSGLNNYLPDWLADPGVWPAAVLAAAVAGTAIWRNVMHAERGGARPSGLRAGLWLGAGQLAGELAANQFLGVEWTPRFPEAFLLLLPVIVPAAVLWWTAGCAALFSDLASGWRRSTAAAVTLSVTGMAFAWWYGWWQAAGTTYAGGMPYSTSAALSFLNIGFAPADQMTPSTTSDIIANLTIIVVTLAIYRWGTLLTAALWIIPLLRRIPGRPSGVTIGLLYGAATGVAILLVTNRAQVWIWHDGQSFIPSMTVYTDWLFAILLFAAIAAATTAALVSRGNAAAAGGAAGTATVIGLIVLLLVNETDGCVHPLSTVYGRCEIASNTDWQVLTLFLPEFLAVAGMASVVAALPIAVAARALEKTPALRFRRRTPGTAAVMIQPRAAGRAISLAWVVGACTVLLGLGMASYTGSKTPEGSTNQRNPDPLITNLSTSPESSLESGLQVWAWGYFGGGPIMGDYEKDLGDIDYSVEPNGSVNVTAMRRGCTNLINAIDRAYAYFPIPVHTQQTAWSAALASTRTQAEDCLNALATSNSTELDRVLTAMNPPVDPVATIIDNLRKLSDPTQRLLLGIGENSPDVNHAL